MNGVGDVSLDYELFVRLNQNTVQVWSVTSGIVGSKYIVFWVGVRVIQCDENAQLSPYFPDVQRLVCGTPVQSINRPTQALE